MEMLLNIFFFIVGIPICGALCFFVWWLVTQCVPGLRKSIHWQNKDNTIDAEKISIGIGSCCVTLAIIVLVDWVIRH